MEDEIAEKSVMLVHRGMKTGITSARAFFDMPRIKEMLDFIGPGENFTNITLKDLKVVQDSNLSGNGACGPDKNMSLYGAV